MRAPPVVADEAKLAIVFTYFFFSFTPSAFHSIGIFNFFYEKKSFSSICSTFYGQRLVTAAWASRSPWSILSFFSSLSLHLLLLTHFGETPEAEILFPYMFWHNKKKYEINKSCFYFKSFFLQKLIFGCFLWPDHP